MDTVPLNFTQLYFTAIWEAESYSLILLWTVLSFHVREDWRKGRGEGVGRRERKIGRRGNRKRWRGEERGERTGKE